MPIEPGNVPADAAEPADTPGAAEREYERLERERRYHNAHFTDEKREAQNKYYGAIYNGRLYYQALVRRLAANADVLEYGCAKGDISLSLAPLCRSIAGIDISDVAVDIANAEAGRLGATNSRFLVMNAEAMTFPDASFDLVFGSGIVHHLDLEKCYAEVARVLRPGGSAVFWEPLGHNALINLYRRWTPEARTPDEHPLLRKDLAKARHYFRTVDVKLYGLTTLLAVPLRNTALFRPVNAVAQAIDRVILAIPGVCWQAWFVCMHLKT